MTHRQRKPMRRTREMEYHFLDYPNNIKRDAVLWMTFDDSDQGGTALVTDHSDFGNHGTNNGATKGVGRNGVSKSFITNDFVSVADDSSLDFIDFTMVVWIKSDYSANQWVVSKPVFGTGFDAVFAANKSINFRFAGSKNDHISDAILVSDVWQHIGIVFDTSSDAVNFYVNGTSGGSDTDTGNIPVNTDPLSIGKVATNFLDGDIDEIIFFDRALSAQEIKDLYEGDL